MNALKAMLYPQVWAIVLLCCSTTLSAAMDTDRYLSSYQIGSELWASPIVKDNIAYIGADNGIFYAVDLEGQGARWTFETGGKIRSDAAISQHLIYFSSDDGYLYALNRWSGVLRWKFNLADGDVERILPANYAPWAFDFTKSSPVVDGQFIYVGSADGHLYAIHKTTGSLRWRFKTEGMIRSTAAVNQQHVYITSWDGSIYALEKATGQLAWTYKTGATISSDPALIGEMLVVGSRDAHLYNIDAQTGKLVWRQPLPGQSWIESTAVEAEEAGYFYIGSSDAKLLMKLEALSGDIVWQADTQGWSWSTPLVTEDAIYIGSVGAQEYWTPVKRGFYAVDPESGQHLWQYQPAASAKWLHGGVYATPATVGENKLVIADLDGYLHLLKADID
ncbi:PQQ-binding-like beta-propeller repeat protein [Thaumasiovibrio subtropicus]|uniref:outer membrane protein assembly factor BamB family protein n=1 Tax=Thaumasiovibrio subtropicus TaxID=1891207 RepID=UPI000B3608F7|nr:PQQ-binding-like beta-propeller repeat protein [Thaumasiovibrio subtropicus]